MYDFQLYNKDFFTFTQDKHTQNAIKTTFTLSYIIFLGSEFDRCIKGRNEITLTFVHLKKYLSITFSSEIHILQLIFNTFNQSFHLRLDNSSQMSGSWSNCEVSDI